MQIDLNHHLKEAAWNAQYLRVVEEPLTQLTSDEVGCPHAGWHQWELRAVHSQEESQVLRPKTDFSGLI